MSKSSYNFNSLLLLLLGVSVAFGDDDIDFAKQIKPILIAHCVDCHGSDLQESGLRLDLGGYVLRGGDRGLAVAIGKPSESLLVKVLKEDGDIPKMPMDLDPLTDAQIALISGWIEQGAQIPDSEKISNIRRTSDHWAFQRIERPMIPDVKGREWVRNGIDYFVLSRLEAEGLTPSREASKETLIRRLSLDLLGVPPTPEQVKQFVSDERPDAYGRLVERFLSSPRYGERWGRHWLDLARYADSNGFTIDGPRQVWKYRDWVVEALNSDISFAEFTIHQMAGDLLESQTLPQLIATGFHRNTLVNQEGGTDDEQFRVEAVVDRVNTVGSAYLGLTVGCAQCHQHKYDPISQRDFYRLYAIFNNCEDNNDANGMAPKINVPSKRQVAAKRQLEDAITAVEGPLNEHDKKYKAGFDDWVNKVAESGDVRWVALDPTEWTTDKGALLNKLPEDNSLLVDFSVPANDVYNVTYDIDLSQITGIRLQTLSHTSLPSMGPGRADNGNFVLSEFLVEHGEKGSDETSASKITTAFADHSQEGYPIFHSIDGNQKTGWAINVKEGSPNVDREAVYIPVDPIKHEGGTRLIIRMRHDHNVANYLVGRFLISVTEEDPKLLEIPASIKTIATKAVDERSDAEKTQLTKAYQQADKERAPLAQKLAGLRSELDALNRSIPTTLVLKELAKTRETRIQIRGDFLRPGAVVTGGVPEVLPQVENVDENQPSRLDFANWLLSRDNPLTARVTINRFWQRFFGLGIVATENDFGTQGELPTHPELLDWLAVEFIDGDWGIKNIHRIIVTSATYRQDSSISSELLELDSTNKLLARQSRVRLEAEAVRDNCLAAAGVLSTTIGGPGVYPPQPTGIYILTQQKKAWPESQGDDRVRRAMYTYFWRSSPYPLMPTFDAPDSTAVCTRRSRSNTPLQALMLANDRAFFEFSQQLATTVLHSKLEGDSDRIKLAFQRCLSRNPSAYELSRLQQYVELQRIRYTANSEAAEAASPSVLPDGISKIEGAAWTATARVLLNLDEFITRE